MTATATGTLNTNSALAVAGATTITTETVVSLYVFEKTGTHKKHEVILQVSPDGTNWIDVPRVVRGKGVLTVTVSATKIRACVLKSEGATSTIDFHLVAN